MQNTQQKQENVCVERIDLLVNLNSSRFSIERPVEKYFKGENKKNEETFACPKVVVLSEAEKRDLMVTTFKMGNMLFHDFSKENNNNVQGHSYSFINIEVNDEIIKSIEAIEKKVVYII